jgi:hypothetical protein
VQTFSGKMGAIDNAYKDNEQKIIAEQHLRNRIEWARDKPVLVAGPDATLMALTQHLAI